MTLTIAPILDSGFRYQRVCWTGGRGANYPLGVPLRGEIVGRLIQRDKSTDDVGDLSSETVTGQRRRSHRIVSVNTGVC